jgi:hypothetical protein
MKTLVDNLRRISLRSDGILLPVSGGAAAQGTATAKELHRANRKDELTAVDMDKFRSILESSDDQLRPQKKHFDQGMETGCRHWPGRG